MSSAPPRPAAGRSLSQAATAAQALLDQLDGYQSALDGLADLRAGAADLRTQVAAAVGPTRALAAAAQDAATTFLAVEQVRPAVERSLEGLTAAADLAATVIADTTTTVAVAAGQRIETSGAAAARTVEAAATRGTEQVEAALVALTAALAAVADATGRIQATVAADGQKGADALVRALRGAAADVRKESATTLHALTDPVQQAERAVGEAREAAVSLRADLLVASTDTSAALARSVADTAAQLRTQLAAADEAFRSARARDFQRLTQLAWATLAAVVLGALAVVFRPAPDAGLPLAGSTLQVLNGVDPRADYAGAVAEQVRAAAGERLVTVVTGDAATARQAQTLVLVHGSSLAAGQDLARQLGMDEARVVRGTPLPLAGHLTLLLGADFRTAIAYPASRE